MARPEPENAKCVHRQIINTPIMKDEVMDTGSLRFGTWNARGLYGKMDRILEVIDENDLDFVFVTETWWDSRRRDPRCVLANNVAPLNPAASRQHYGTAVIKNPRRNIRFPFEFLHAGEEGKCQVFRYGGALFIGCYIPPSAEEDDHWISVLTKWIRLRRVGEPVFVLGDLNMRLGVEAGDRSRNSRANTIGALLRSHGLAFAADGNGEPTCITGPGCTSIVDYVFFDPSISSTLAYEVNQEELLSDHQMVWVDMQNVITSPPVAVAYEAWKLIRLQREDVRRRYGRHFEVNEAAAFEAHALAPFQTQEELDHCYEEMMNCVVRSAKLCIGTTNRPKSWIPPLSSRLNGIRQKIKLLRIRLQHGDETARPEFNEMCALRRVALGYAEEELQERWSDFVVRFDSLQSNELLKVCRSFKMARQGNKAVGLPMDEVSMENHAGSVETQFSLPADARHIDRLPLNLTEEPMLYFLEKDVAFHIWKYPRGKSGGPSGLRMELFKPLNRWIAGPLAKFFQRCYELGLVPTAWCRARIVPIPKKAGASTIKDYRPISLTEVVRKIFERCLIGQLIDEIGHADYAQGGFEPHKGTREQVACLNETFRLRELDGQPPCVAFLDIKAAYDSVDRNVLHNRLVSAGAKHHTIRIVMALFDQNESRIAIGGRESRLIAQRAGLQQGSILSPCLYNLFIGEIQEHLRAHNDGDPLTSFWYADDGAVVAQTPRKLQELMAAAEQFSIERNFRFSPTKCEVMNVNGAITVYGQPLPHCSQFKYLGVWFDKNGANWKLHFSKMVDKARNQLQFWRSVGYNAAGFKPRTRRMVYVVFLRPVVEYCLSICPPLKMLTNMLERFQGEALRGMFSVGKCTSQAALRAVAGVTTFEHRRLELRARFEFPLVHRNATHMTTVVRGEMQKSRRRPLKRLSCFADFGSNPILQWHAERVEQERQVQVLFGTRMPTPRKLQQSVLECRAMHLRRDREGCARTMGLRVDDDCKPRYLYSLSHLASAHSRLLFNWLLGRYVGKPVLCLRCNTPNSGTRHFLECCAAQGIDQLCWAKRWRLAMVHLHAIFSAAHGYEPQGEILARALALSPNNDEDTVGSGVSLLDEVELHIYE